MSSQTWPDESMFQHFTVFEETFKVVESHEIKAAILIPKGAKPGSHPVILNTHGGFLTYGHSLFAPFFSPWALKLALENAAIVVSADYRLLPSANGVADVLEDLEDFWQWTHTDLAEILERRATGHSLDLSRVMVTGQSAGGYTTMQLALSHPDEISAVAVAYPFVNPKDRIMTEGPAPGEPTVLRFAPEDIPSKQDVEAWIENAKKTITTKAGFERTRFSVGSAQHGIFYSQIFDSSNLNRPDFLPIERLKAGARLPQNIWILHGGDDSVVYLRTTEEFVRLGREKLPDTNIRFDIAPGEDHAFDLLKTWWELYTIGAMDFVKKSWLRE